jgi:hypothetical protein
MFRPKWPSSAVQVSVVQDSTAHCNAVFFPPIVIFGFAGCTWLLWILFGLVVVAAFSVPVEAAES